MKSSERPDRDKRAKSFESFSQRVFKQLAKEIDFTFNTINNVRKV